MPNATNYERSAVEDYESLKKILRSSERFRDYRLIKSLGRGGTAFIWLVEHPLLGERRALKFLTRDWVEQSGGDDVARQRFIREAKTARNVRHPNIVEVLDVAILPSNLAVIEMEYVDGISLDRHLKSFPEGLPVAQVLAIACQVLQALAQLHARGFVHRDIAPDNLMLQELPGGEFLVKLIDLGIVGSHGVGPTRSVFMGKVRYAAPEAWNNEIYTQSDIYSLGVVLYELATGKRPFPQETIHELMVAHLHGEPLSFDVTDPARRVPHELQGLIVEMMRKDPRQRIGDTRLLLERFELFCERLGSRSAPAETTDAHWERTLVSSLVDQAPEGGFDEVQALMNEAFPAEAVTCIQTLDTLDDSDIALPTISERLELPKPAEDWVQPLDAVEKNAQILADQSIVGAPLVRRRQRRLKELERARKRKHERRLRQLSKVVGDAVKARRLSAANRLIVSARTIAGKDIILA